MTARPFPRTAPLLATLALAATLAACGGGDDDTAAAAASGGTLTLSATSPSSDTTIDLSTATAKGTNGRAADSFSSVPYCEIFWENANGANGRKYAVQVYYRQDNKLPLHVSVVESGGWAVFSNDSGATITGITIDTTARTAVFNNKVLAGSAGEAGTLAGTASFGSSTTAACGA
ncbi:hypothetical protein [Pseudaquabacterium pictum]|uniref:Lipoprotein n=1 Tax=Pseudaquabacterium pictum TaxID=2315236 RepID=A0A480B1S6_9BURK|nr:hypothetical protein [Rubrivivax pictus]GCL65825.1 hypothetical protein AQPW35_49060 [Rubrivivax pictus]